MQDEIIKLGRLLKAMREDKKLSLKEVESATSIRESYLEVIEEGKAGGPLSDFYRFGFIRQYASFLEMDMEDLENKYPVLFQNVPQKHDFAYGIGTLEMRNQQGQAQRSVPSFVWAIGTCIMLVLAWQLGKYLQVF
jgi:cytoskeletal protein RodZ